MSPIANLVLGDLGFPVRAIRGRQGSVFGAAMPEAAIDEHRDLSARKDQVGPDLSSLAGFDRKVDAIPQAGCMGCAPYGSLRGRVASPV